MVFTRTSASEIVKNIFSVFFILLAIISATQIVRFLGYAAKGQLSNDSVFFFFFHLECLDIVQRYFVFQFF